MNTEITREYETTIETLKGGGPDCLDNMLEAMIDKVGLPKVLSAIAAVCTEKSCHIQENWQDSQLANQWGKLALKLAKVAHNTPRL